MSGGFDSTNALGHAYAVHVHESQLSIGSDEFTAPVNYGTGFASASVFVEPQQFSKVGPVPGPTLDSMTRLVMYTSYSGNMSAADLNFELQFTRDGSNYTPIGGVLQVGTATDITSLHVFDNILPHDFMQSDGVDIDDLLAGRIRVIPTASSQGQVLVGVATALVPGPITGMQTPPRGTIFSKFGIHW